MPLSTLLMIVAAFGGYEQVMEAYNVALKKRITVSVLMEMRC